MIDDTLDWIRLHVRTFVGLCLLATVATGLFAWLIQPSRPPVAELRDAASIAGFLMALAAASGVAAMATVQFWKIAFHARYAFHHAQLQRIFGSSLGEALGFERPSGKGNSVPYRHQSVSLLEFLDNPTEVVMGQLRSVAEYVMLRPEGYEGTLYLFAGPAGKDAVYHLLSIDRHLENHRDDAAVAVRFFVEQHLNLIHAKLKARWRRQVRLMAVLVSFGVGLLAVRLSGNLGPLAQISVAVAAAVWGGFFSWLARDLVARLERPGT